MVADDDLQANRLPVSQRRPAAAGGSGAMLDLNDPSAFLAAAFPGPEGEGATLLPAGPERERQATVEGEPIKPPSENNREHARRAAEALAKVHSTAQQRGLLKEATDPAASPQAEAALEMVMESGSRVRRLQALANWVGLAGGVHGVFLIDERGYSLLPEAGAEESRAEDESAALQDLGLHLAAVLDRAPRRLGDAGDGVRVARLAVSDDRVLAVFRSASGKMVLGWIEAADDPLGEALVARARSFLAAALGDSSNDADTDGTESAVRAER